MGKEKPGFLSPKAISNRIKAKGLQKLRWYCQMCQKQCRDENGFKCHTMSESHQRQLLLVADNPGKFVNTFSQEFFETFIELLRRRFGTKRVHGNVVYQEYIADRHHVHMNATQWVTLTQFVKWMGRQGYCTVDETEKGWFIQYIDRTPEAIRRQQAQEKKSKMDVDDEDRRNKMIQQQIERDRMRRHKDGVEAASIHKPTELMKASEDDKVVFKIPLAVDTSKITTLNSSKNDLNDLETMSTCSSRSTSSSSSSNAKRKQSALDEIIKMEETKKAKIGRKDYWLTEGIVIKIITKKAGEQYFKKKAVVKEVVEKYGAVVKLLEGGDKIKLDQVHLETVLPSIGKQVYIVNGAYRGHTATLQQINIESFSCNITIDAGPLNGRQLKDIPYEDVCKLHQS
ncbi:hypothetical protein HELRODRAFT_71298 [Helobdella robusta]|uniref:DNA/RNA-binding protein Kin17 WH-like domain-containing protein n=1 Tax=Helobdella robusta TaxID=6412 RepID=T1G0J2_HELRO|nr:hypothetical protein HELRODRAFT_71298 [Helobdella robusta]ESO11689.1 hypothetical protein HELRODRAFT_71298 [Helobdella robusta]